MDTSNLKYPLLCGPIRVRDTVLRNRMISTASTPHFLQGLESGPTEKIISHFANRARSGAAAVTVNHFHKDVIPIPGRAIDNPPMHFNLYDLSDGCAQNYLCQLIDAIHFHGAKATGYLMADPGWFYEDGVAPPGQAPPFPQDGPPRIPDSSETEKRLTAESQGPPQMDVSQITREMIGHYIRNLTREAVDLKRLGFDIISLHSCYRHSPHARFLSPLTNSRTDEYGGDAENRSRFLLDIYRSLRKALGNTPLEVVYSVSEPEGGYTLEDTVRFAQMAEGLVDILHLRSGEMDPQHPVGFTSREDCQAPYLEEMGEVTKSLRRLGLPMLVGASAGFHDPAIAEQALADGKADLICMARSWISNVDYGIKVLEGKDNEITPCIRCNKCHVSNGRDMWRSVCSVNPRLGMEDKLDRMTVAPVKSLKIAVVGGGPAGMGFGAQTAARGHDVTLYESSGKLGGQLCHADYPTFKWPLRQFKEFLIRRQEECGVRLLLNTEAAPDALRAEGFDVIAVAAGSEPSAPPIPGADGPNVFFASGIYGSCEDRLGDPVIVIGGGEIGVETALYLCELGKRVMVLEMLPELIHDAPHAHYKNMVRDYWRRQPNFRYRCGVVCTAIDADGVRYLTHDGKEEKSFGESVLIATGTKPRADRTMSFAGCAPRVFAIGDCDEAGNVQKAMRSAYGMAMSL